MWICQITVTVKLLAFCRFECSVSLISYVINYANASWLQLLLVPFLALNVIVVNIIHWNYDAVAIPGYHMKHLCRH